MTHKNDEDQSTGYYENKYRESNMFCADMACWTALVCILFILCMYVSMELMDYAFRGLEWLYGF